MAMHEFLARTQSEGHPRFSAADDTPLQQDINGNIRDIYMNLGRT